MSCLTIRRIRVSRTSCQRCSEPPFSDSTEKENRRVITSNSYLQIDLQAIKENIEQLRREIEPGAKLIPVLKGNAYGLGAVTLGRIISDLGGIDSFAVSQVAEGVELREAGLEQQILVMSLPLDAQVEAAVEPLKLDTGLHRIGFRPEEIERLIAELKQAEDVIEIRDTFSHFSEHSREQMDLQSRRFRDFREKLLAAGIQPGLCHMASSASLASGEDVLFDAVRVGRRLILDNPDHPTGKIREAVSYRAWLADVRERRAGDTLGYDRRVVLERDTRVGVLSIGYGDGFDPALFAAHAPVLIRGRRARLLACCMDQSFVDLGDLPAEAGDEVTLFGRDGEGNLLPGQEVAALIGCEGCDLTARLTERVARVYTGA